MSLFSSFLSHCFSLSSSSSRSSTSAKNEILSSYLELYFFGVVITFAKYLSVFFVS